MVGCFSSLGSDYHSDRVYNVGAAFDHCDVKVTRAQLANVGMLYLTGCEGHCDRVSHGGDVLAHSELKVTMIEVSLGGAALAH